jgi:RNA recognition motif-containing protein
MGFSPGAIYITNLNRTVTKDSLVSYFKRFGSIRQAVLRPAKRSALILFSTEESANSAIREANYEVLSDPFPIQIKRAFVRHTLLPGSRLAVRGLDPSITERILYVTFSAYGELDSLEILRTRRGKSRGIALIQFLNAENAKSASTSLHGTTLSSGWTPLRISFAPVHSKDISLHPLSDFAVAVSGPTELRAPELLAVLFTPYSSVALEIAHFGTESVILFIKPEEAIRCAAEFDHPQLSVFTFTSQALVKAANVQLDCRSAFVRGYAADDFTALPTVLGSVWIEAIDSVTAPAAIARFASVSDRDQAIALNNGRRIGENPPLIVLPFISESAFDQPATLAIIYENSLSLCQNSLAEVRALAVSICPTCECESYGFALFQGEERPAIPGALFMQIRLETAMKAFTAQDRRIIVLHGILESESLDEELANATRRGRVGSEIVAYFESGEAANEVFMNLTHSGRSVDIFTDAGLSMAKNLTRQTMENKAVFVSKLPKDVRHETVRRAFECFGKITFSALTYSRKSAIVTFVTESSARKAIAGPYDPELGDLRVEQVRDY